VENVGKTPAEAWQPSRCRLDGKRFLNTSQFFNYSNLQGPIAMKKFILFAAVVAVSGLIAQSVLGATASQTFTVTVPTNVSITAPSNVSLYHDETDNNQVFPNQSWTVKGNVQNGVSVSFATNQAFTHTTNASFKRNAKLDLATGTTLGPATWTVTKATDTTDYVGGNGVATVTAASNGVGRAAFNLGVTFITDSYATFAAGDYTTTVTGTVTAN
jgi:hypothetical protein